ncbi:SCAR-like protein 1 [Selaginella moellendorffii]|uniref:SCAR-like protein 1 n=1 Tax=Selaginella moellendorffii TaxID=88036 RepID=UPI000D1C6BBF|nr:SCAR-like protein 1 [Selaginella moellendorffii]XP_024522468.1 SCAR-like protein 1 [Selaginella moellendorffii]|eukprot:XP_024522467.1 SCAR-like protein 1 [Selaginella moellendorffii]
MPLVRYELRSEYELANRELYRSAPKNDPEAILEGVSMVSLVGIVRQLGDLAEFAADVFHELHEAVMTTASRSHDLVVRVSQLEGELPALEKAILSRKTNPLQFPYAPGLDWHASIRNDQNLCTQGDLPRFIRSSYEECRGPPRLFLLDKFDVGGVGACLKRYTDPSFFKMEWASSEIMKAEKAQQDKKARRSKKPRRRKEGEVKDSRPPPVQFQHPRARYSTISVSSVDGLSESATTPLTNMAVESDPSSKPFPFVTFLGGSQQSSKESTVSLSGKSPMSVRKSVSKPVAAADKEEEDRIFKESSSKTIEGDTATRKEEKVDDAASDTEQFLDAMTTMESETDSEPREKRRLSNFRQSKVVRTKKAENDEDAPFEDARNLAIDSETEAESKYSLDLTPISVEPRSPVHHENVQLSYEVMNVENDAKVDVDRPDEVPDHPNISEDLRLEYEDRDLTDDEGEYPEKDLPPEDENRLEYPEEEDFEVESRTTYMNDVLELENEEKKLLELHQDSSGVVEDVNRATSPAKAASRTSNERDVNERDDIVDEAALASDKDYIEESPDDEGAALESTEISDAEVDKQKAEETEEQKITSELEDEEPFDVEVIQVIGDNGDTKKEVEFEPLLASDDEGTIEDNEKREDEADDHEERLSETKANVHEIADTSDAPRQTETVTREESASFLVREAEISREESAEVYRATEVAEQAVSGHSRDSNAIQEDEPEQHIIGLENVQTKAAPALERNESLQASSPMDVFESASSQENFFSEEISSRFSAFSDENNTPNNELEVEELYSMHDGYSADDDSMRNGHSEAASELHWTPAGSTAPSGDGKLEIQQQNEAERDLSKDGKESDEREGSTVDVNQQLLSRLHDLSAQQHEDELVHSLPSDSKAQGNEIGNHKVDSDDDNEVDLDRQMDKQDVEEHQQHAESTISSSRQLEEIERPTSQQASPKLQAFDTSKSDGDAIWAAEDNTSDKSEESLSSSPRSPVFGVLSPAKSADSLESEVATILAPSSPTSQSMPSPMPEEMPPLPPLPPLRWRTSLFMPRDSGLFQREPPSLEVGAGDHLASAHEPPPQVLVASETSPFQAVDSPEPQPLEDTIDRISSQPETLVDKPLPDLHLPDPEPPSQPSSFLSRSIDVDSLEQHPSSQSLANKNISNDDPADAIPVSTMDEFREEAESQEPSDPETSPRTVPLTVADVPPALLVDDSQSLAATGLSHPDDKTCPDATVHESLVPPPAEDNEVPTIASAREDLSHLDDSQPLMEVSVFAPASPLTEQLPGPGPVAEARGLPESSLPPQGHSPTDASESPQAPSSPRTFDDLREASVPPQSHSPGTIDDLREVSVPPLSHSPTAARDSPQAPWSPGTIDDLREASVPPQSHSPGTIDDLREVSVPPLSHSPTAARDSPQAPWSPGTIDDLQEVSVPPQTHWPTDAKESPRAPSSPGTIDDVREVSVPPRSPSPTKEFPDASSPVQAAQTQPQSPVRTEVSIPLQSPESFTASKDSPEALVLHPVGEQSVDPPEVLKSPPSRPVDDSPTPPPPRGNLDEEPETFPADAPSPSRKDLPGDALIQAISVHDRTKLKRVPSDVPGVPKAPDEREVLLEQIRSQSFNLRHTIVEKKEIKETTPRLVTNINVAAILEKANAIRQSLADSEDEEDDWSE